MADDDVLGSFGYIGLGDMGYGIGMNIARSGIEMLAYDLRPELKEDVESWGARWAQSSRQVLEESDVVGICLLDDKQVRAFVEAEALFATMRPGSTLIVFSTVDPGLMRELHREGAERGIEVLGNPVSGAYPASMAGTLTVMVGGDEAAYRRLMPIWQAMGEAIFWLGEDPGAGQIAKLMNNLIGLSMNLVAVEVMDLARGFGIDEQTLLSVVRTSSGNGWMIENWGVMDRLLLTHPKGGPDHGHIIALKDIHLAISAARDAGGDPRIAEAVVAMGERTLAKRYALLEEREPGKAR